MKATDEEAIRDQIVMELRESISGCGGDQIAHAPQPRLEEITVEWGPGCPDGVVLRTERGVFQVKVSVDKLA